MAHRPMQFQDFLRCTDFACQYALTPRFEWKGRESPKQPQSWMRKIIFIISAISLTYANIGLFAYGYLLDRKSMDPLVYFSVISDTGGMLAFTALGTLNMFMLLMYRPQIEDVLAELQDLFEEREKFNCRNSYYFEKSTRSTNKYAVMYIFCNVYYNTAPLVIMAYDFLSESREVVYGQQTDSWYPWKTKGSMPGFCAAYICQIFSSALNVSLMMLIQFSVHVCATQLELHFDGLVKQLQELDARNPGAKDTLKTLIVYHRRLLQLAESVNSIFNFTFFASLTTTTFAICVMAFNLTMLNFITAIKYSLGLVFYMIYTFSLCQNGTDVTLVSEKVMPACFYNNWYEGDLAYRKMLLIMMMRSTKPYMWRTYKLAPVSITTYMATLKFSYQMFTCVRSLK